jgi:hypothetical protein
MEKPSIGLSQGRVKPEKRLAVIGVTKVETLKIGGDPLATVFFEELKRLGYVEGENLIVDRWQLQPGQTLASVCPMYPWPFGEFDNVRRRARYRDGLSHSHRTSRQLPGGAGVSC